MCKICILLFGKLPTQGTLSQLLRCMKSDVWAARATPNQPPCPQNAPVAQSNEKIRIFAMT